MAAVAEEAAEPAEVEAPAGGILEGVEHDEQLWRGRRPSMELVKEHAENTAQAEAAKGRGQGLWPGVVFPCMGNILGVILFLRAPWIVGRAGIANGFSLVFICCLCTFVTSLSLSAVSTNGKIKGGGSYYLISRSLGPALGAGVGLCFYMANSIGAAMYFMGTVEAWEMAFPNKQILKAGDMNNIRVTALVILSVCLCIVGGGIKYVARLGTFFLMIVLFVILCMYLGAFIGPDQPGTTDSMYMVDQISASGTISQAQLEWGGIAGIGEYFSQNWAPGWELPQKAYPGDTTIYNFISMMGLWFPANTGIMAGSNRSADLRDPSGDIPRGTLFAQLSTSFIYLSFILIYGCIAPRETLLNDRFFASTSAWPLKEIVIYGVMASTIGAGLSSLTSGTRLLSAIAADKTLPILRIFAAKPGKEPRLALLASGVLCCGAIGIGELNAVAPILTMFFLMCYTCVNASVVISEAVQDPNWRPTWRYYHWSISLFGFVQCILMMFLIDVVQALLAVAFCCLVMSYSAYHSHAVKWGDGLQGMKFQVARNILQKIDMKTHTKNWRPQLLVVTEAKLHPHASGDAEQEEVEVSDPELLKLVSQLKGGRGITIIGGIVSAKGDDAIKERGFFLNAGDTEALKDGYCGMLKLLKEYQIEGFGHLMYTENFLDGLQSLIQVAGLGSFQPNCIMASWPKDNVWQDLAKTGYLARSRLLRMVQMAVAFDKVMLVAKGKTWPELGSNLTGTIDIWWIVGDGGILLLLPHLLKKHKVWAGCKTRLFLIAQKVGQDHQQMEDDLKRYVKDFRLDVEVKLKIIEHGDAELLRVRSFEEGELAPLPAAASVPVPEPKVPESTAKDQKGTAAAVEKGVLGGAAAKPKTVFSLDDPPEKLLADSPTPTSPKLEDDDAPRRVTSSPAMLGEPKAKAEKKPVPVQRTMSPVNSIGHFDANQLTNMSVDSLKKQMEGNGKQRTKTFVNSGHQLSSTAPCAQEELNVAIALGRVIREESRDSEMVVTNLPDMPPGESAFGYFQVVHEITKGLNRCILVRGTASEVITQFT